MTSLYYYPASSSLSATIDNSDITQFWTGVTSLVTSGSGYNANISGSDFIGTVAVATIYAYSGSTILATFPVETTNIFYYPFPSNTENVPTSSNNIGIQYTTYMSQSDIDPSYYFKIINSSSLEIVAQTGLFPSSYINFTTALSSSTTQYNIQLYSGNNKNNNIYLYNSASILLLSSSWIGTASSGIYIHPTGSNFFYISASVYNICCPSELFSITDDGSYLIFSYITGSCGTYSGSISIQSSLNQSTWTTIGSGSFASPYTASLLIPTSSLYYRIISNCSGGYSSDPSNTLHYEYLPPS